MDIIRSLKFTCITALRFVNIIAIETDLFWWALAILATIKAEEASEISVYSFLLLAPGVGRDFCI